MPVCSLTSFASLACSFKKGSPASGLRPFGVRHSPIDNSPASNETCSSNTMYSHRVLEQFQNTSHVGELPDADAYVQVDNPVCGDILRLSVKVRQGRIVDARFRARGCVAAIACAAQLADMICDRSLEEARSLTREELVAALQGLPETSLHASHLALDALNQALKQLS